MVFFLFVLRRFSLVVTNGGNFVVAERQLKDGLRMLDSEFETELNKNRTKWIFKPSHSPLMSVAMEPIVKITKRDTKK